MGIGVPEALLILGALTLLFGGKKIPELATGMGKAIIEFRKSVKDDASKEIKAAHMGNEESSIDKQETGGTD